ncbi:uncharacterized protein METZ01_LOCUS506999, partial [marine metagenome]
MRNDEDSLFSLLHLRKRLIPARNDTPRSDRKLKWRSTITRAVKLGAISQCSSVVSGNRRTLCRRIAGTFLHHNVAQSGLGS